MKHIIFSVLAGTAFVSATQRSALWSETNKTNDNFTLRIAFPYSKPITQYDPTRITLAPEHVLLENIYSPLVQLDKDGAITGGIASKFEWVGIEAHFTIRENLKAADGTPITANDVAASFKRTIILTHNTHGNIKDLLCPNTAIKRLTDACPGIEVRGTKLILKPGKQSTVLFPMLASADFGIIPQSSIDPDTLAIRSYERTSGPYYIKSDDGAGHMVLGVNKNHYHYNTSMPQAITLTPTDPKNPNHSFELLETNKVDLLTTIDAAQPDAMLGFASRHKGNYFVHQTYNVRTLLIAFSEKGLKRFTPDERAVIGKRVRALFGEYAKTVQGYKETTQFYPTFGVGGLSEANSQLLKKRFDSVKLKKFNGTGMRAHLVRVGRQPLFSKILNEVLPGIQVVEGRNPSFVDYSKNPDDMPEVYISAPDAGALEDIGLISYSFNAGYSAVPKKDRVAWLASYAAETNKRKRLERLQEIHFKTLAEPVLVPLAVSPYVSISNKKWSHNFSKHYGNSPLWQLVKN